MDLWEKKNKDKYGKNCHEQRRHFSIFFLSVDGMIVKEALVLLMTLSWLFAEKLEETISYVHGWVNSGISIESVML